MKKFIYGAMSFGLLFTACSSDNLMEPTETGRRDVDRTYYLNVSIHGDSDAFTRAAVNDGNPVADTDFKDGVDNGNYKESEVTTVYFVFYDKDGNVVGDLVQAKPDWIPVENSNNTVEKYGQVIVQIDVPKTSGDPASVICYINPIAPQSLQFDLSSIQTVLRDRVWRQEFGFAMSNSVYYTTVDEMGNPIKDEEGNNISLVNATPRIDVPIQDGQLKTTYADAEADDNAYLDIYVERYAAKLSFQYAENATVEDYTTTSPVIGDDGLANSSVNVSLHFKDQRWALNAEAKNTYMIKSFRQESSTGQILADNYTFGNLNNIITGNLSRKDGEVVVTGGSTQQQTGQWIWNNPSYHRSYWAMSPAYFTSEYPEVSSDVTDNSLQVYYSYNDLNVSGAGFPLTTTTGYFKETTVGSLALTSKNPKAAVASVILTGTYDVTVNEVTYPNQTFYTYNRSVDGKDLVYFPAGADGTSVIPGTESMISRLIAATSVLYVKEKDEEGKETGNFISASKDDILPYVEIGKHEHSESGTVEDENLKISSRLRTLELISDVTTVNSGLYIGTGSGYMEIVSNPTKDANDNIIGGVTDATKQVTLDEANENIYQQVGSCALYDGGKAYFNIPVMHYGWYRNGNPNKDKALSDIEWSDVHVGDFGVVRNHSYKVEVSELKGLGTAIADPNDPIVPPADTESYYVKYRVNILKWAVVPTQTVKL